MSAFGQDHYPYLHYRPEAGRIAPSLHPSNDVY